MSDEIPQIELDKQNALIQKLVLDCDNARIEKLDRYLILSALAQTLVEHITMDINNDVFDNKDLSACEKMITGFAVMQKKHINERFYQHRKEQK